MIKATQVACLGHHRHCRHEWDTPDCLERRNGRRHRPGRHEFDQRRLQTIHSFDRCLHRVQHFLVRQALCRMREVLSVKPTLVSPAPACLAVVAACVPEQERADVLALATIILNRHGAGTHQVPYRLVRLIRNPDCCQFTGSQQTRQGLCIPPVGLHPIAGPSWDQRWCNDNTLMAESQDLPIQPVAGRTGFIANVQFAVSRSELPDQPRHTLRRGIELAHVSDLAVPTGLRDRHRVAQLRDVDPNKDLLWHRHDPSSCDEDRLLPRDMPMFLCSANEPFSAPTDFLSSVARSRRQAWPQATAQRRTACLTTASTTPRWTGLGSKRRADRASWTRTCGLTFGGR